MPQFSTSIQLLYGYCNFLGGKLNSLVCFTIIKVFNYIKLAISNVEEAYYGKFDVSVYSQLIYAKQMIVIKSTYLISPKLIYDIYQSICN